ncbi:uroporphyrinogen-III synthase [Leucobacter sp. CSA1]|uniref:Uroporphyrinogen-III synthase n=1 Tax=Leucobacter chromiisoli TaxID=2796471 RepID=A0A934Q4P6_9MICO|nr:uroporphyrinogen-III synthase [Leucobacter chromiisoli]MBK0417506.1 uroporphyrinogen-III synthase [Leucobacter chromiisoli]
MTADAKPLSGLRVLVPRGGTWGDMVAKALREQGASPVIAPLVDFAHTSEEDKLIAALKALEAGEFQWITATSSTVVDVLAHHNAVIPPTTQVAVVGEATEAAFKDAGYPVSRTPNDDNNTTEGLLEVWPEIDTGEVLRVLTLRSDVAKPVLTQGLINRGHDVTQVVAFRTVGVPVSVHTREDVESGRINALLVASPKIAREVAQQFPDIPEDTIVACVGPFTHGEAVSAGLRHNPDHADSSVKRALIETVESAIDQSDMLD